jgi:hypothetical protein
MVPLYKFQLFGVLFALAIYNGITLPVSFPLAFYKKLLFQTPSEAELAEGWPSLARSLHHLQMHPGSVEEDFARDYVYSFDANGLHLDVSMDDPWNGWSVWDKIRSGKNMSLGRLKVIHQYPDKHHPISKSTHTTRSSMQDSPDAAGYTNPTYDQTQSEVRAHESNQSRFEWPGWKVEFADLSESPQSVTNDNRQEFISSYCNWVMDWSIRPQFNAFAKGFYSVLNLRPLTVSNCFMTTISNYAHTCPALECRPISNSGRRLQSSRYRRFAKSHNLQSLHGHLSCCSLVLGGGQRLSSRKAETAAGIRYSKQSSTR